MALVANKNASYDEEEARFMRACQYFKYYRHGGSPRFWKRRERQLSRWWKKWHSKTERHWKPLTCWGVPCDVTTGRMHRNHQIILAQLLALKEE